jgi:hypothetical protein
MTMQIFLVTALAVEILTTQLPKAVVHRDYLAAPLVLSGGGFCPVNNIFTKVVFGELPPGLELSATGYLRGIPERMGSYTFLVRAGNDCSYTTRRFTLEVDGAPLLSVSEERLVFSKGAEPRMFTVSSSWRDMAYGIRMEPVVEWLQVEPLRGRTPVEDSGFVGDPVTATVDAGKLEPGTYRTSLRVWTWQGANQLVIPVVLEVR